MSESLTPAHEQAMRARLAAADAGGWRVIDEPSEDWLVIHPVKSKSNVCRMNHRRDTAKADAEFIAHAPNDLAAALDALDETRAEFETLRKIVDRLTAERPTLADISHLSVRCMKAEVDRDNAQAQIKAALDMAARRWSEWGSRAESVWEILDPEDHDV